MDRPIAMNIAIALAAVSFGTLLHAETLHFDAGSSDWKPLFVDDLSNAIAPEGVWTFTDGILTANADKCIWTQKKHQDYVLDLEFKTAEGTNSGVIVHCSNTKNWVPNSIEIQIADDHSEKWSKADKTWQCGAIFGRLAASESAVKKPGEWNRYTITCKNRTITVVLNGKKVTTMDMSKWTSGTHNPDGSKMPKWLNKPVAEMKPDGHIGFQGKHAGAPIYFRNMRIRSLSSK